MRCLGNWFNISQRHFQHARVLNETCKRHRDAATGKRLPRASVRRDEECTRGHKVRLTRRDCEQIAAHAGLAHNDRVLEVRQRFRVWRRSLKQRGDSDSDDEDGVAAPAPAAAAADSAASGSARGEGELRNRDWSDLDHGDFFTSY